MLRLLLFFSACILIESTWAQVPSSEQTIIQAWPVLDMANKLEEINNSYTKCSTNSDGSIETFCLKDPVNLSERANNKLVYKATDLNQIPEEIKKIIPLPTEPISKSYPLYISLALDNDNILMGLVPSGNDTGYTHGILIDVGGTDKKGITWGGSIFTGLFSKEVDLYTTNTGERFEIVGDSQSGYLIDGKFYEGIWGDDDTYYVNGNIRIEESEMKKIAKEKNSQLGTFGLDENGNRLRIKSFGADLPDGKEAAQHFKEETIFKAFANNNLQGKWYLWNAEAGFAYLNSQKVNKFLASGIQESWHKLLGKDNAVLYEYLPDKNDDKIALLLKASVGVQKDLFKSKTCVVKISTNLGYRLGSSDENSYVFGDATAQLQLNGRKNPHKILSLDSTLNVQKLKKDFSGDITLGVSYQTRKIKYFTTFLLPMNAKNVGAPSTYQDKDAIQRIGVLIPLNY